MRGPGQEAAGLRAGAGGDGGEERHVAPQPASVHHPGPVSGPEGGSQPSDQLHVSLARLQPAELPPAAPRTQRAAQRSPVSDELLLPRPAPLLQLHPHQRQPAAGHHHRALPGPRDGPPAWSGVSQV